MKFQCVGIIIDVSEFIDKVKPLLTSLLYSESVRNYKYLELYLNEHIEWVIKRLIDDLFYREIISYQRHDIRYEKIYLELKNAYCGFLEIDFHRTLLNVLSMNMMPEKLSISLKGNYIILKRHDSVSWL